MKPKRLLEKGQLERRAELDTLYRGGEFSLESHEMVASGDDGPDFLVMEFAFGSEYEVPRWFGFESVEMTPRAADLSRVSQGVCPVVFNHGATQIGVVESVTIGSDRRARARVRFSRGKAAHDVVQDIVDGIRKGVSFGYEVHEMELRRADESGDHYTATRWTLWELTFAPMPLDPTVGSHRSAGHTTPAVIRRAEPKEGHAMRVRAYDNELGQWVEVDESLVDGKRYVRAAEAPAPDDPPKPPAPETPAPTQTAPEVRSDRTAPSERDDGAVENERKRVSEVRDVTKRFKASDELVERALSQGWDAQKTFSAIQLERAQAGDIEPVAPPATQLDLSQKDVGAYRITRAMEVLAKRAKGHKAESCLEIEMSEAIEENLDAPAQGIYVPYDILSRSVWSGKAAGEDLSKRAVSTTAPVGGPGGNLIETELRAGAFIELLVNKTLAGRLGVTVVPGLVGNVDFPKETGGITPGWVAEGAGAGSSDPEFGTVSMSPKTIRARTDMTRRMRLQSTPGIEMIVRNALMRDVGIHVDAAVFDGAGGDAPTGIRSQSGVQTQAYTTTNGLTEFQSIVAMETLVAEANADDLGSMAYATTPGVRGRLKTKYVSGTQDSPAIWTGRRGEGELNGYRAEATQNLPRTLGGGSNEHSLLFGAFSECLVGEWGVLDLMPDEITLADSGGLVIRAFQDIDVALRHAVAFVHSQLNPAA